jgi:subfamily B ATP-binding cassette protein HlyB/CyaB
MKRRGGIEVRNLGFRYDDKLPWLYRNLNLSVEPGACVAIMGPSGCGKSTLAKLLQGFFQPTEGTIKLDGHDIRHLAANELRSALGVVPQETILFSGTIYDNLILGSPMVAFDDVIVSCKAAGIHDSIEALPQATRPDWRTRGRTLATKAAHRHRESATQTSTNPDPG